MTEQAGVPVFAFPALQAEKDGVAVRLAKTPEEAWDVTGCGLAALMERQLSNDLGWLERDLRAVKNLGPLISTLAPAEELQAQAFQEIRAWVCGRTVAPLTAAVFGTVLDRAKADLRGIVPRFCDQLREILTLRQTLMVQPGAHAGLERDLAALLPPDFCGRRPTRSSRIFRATSRA